MKRELVRWDQLTPERQGEIERGCFALTGMTREQILSLNPGHEDGAIYYAESLTDRPALPKATSGSFWGWPKWLRRPLRIAQSSKA